MDRNRASSRCDWRTLSCADSPGEHLEPARYGELALGLTIGALVNQVVTGGVSASIGRFYSIASEKYDLASYLKASSRLLGWSALYPSDWSSFAGCFTRNRPNRMGTINCCSHSLVANCSGLNSTLNGVKNAARQRHIVALHSGGEAWLKIGFALALTL